MNVLKSFFTLSILAFTFSSCIGQKVPDLDLFTGPIAATVQGDLLVGESVLNDKDRFVWGGSVVKGKDGKFHMLYSTWHAGDSIPKFSDSWVLYSEIAHAVSDYPDRGFKFKNIVLSGGRKNGDSLAWDAQLVHNPHVKFFDNKFYLYYIGGADPGPQAVGTPGANLNARNRVQQSLKIGVIEFDSFEDLDAGKFKRSDSPLLVPRTRVKPNNIINPSPEGTQAKPDNIILANPAVERRPSDGKYLLYFKGNLYDPHWRGVHGVAIGDSPIGPFVSQDDIIFDVKMPDGRIASAEDPYVWYHKKNQAFYAIFKDFSGQITQSEPGLAIMKSRDGIKWELPKKPLLCKKEVLLKNGQTIKVNRLERPQLFIDEDGNPTTLYVACSLVDINPRQDGASFNVQIPLRQ